MPGAITHVSFSSAGGAGSVARILSEEQRRQGLDSRVISVISGGLRTSPLSAPLNTIAAGVDEYLAKKADFPAPISLFRDNVRGLQSSALEGSEIIHLHGINGALRIEDLSTASEKTRVVWTLHDMNPFTGACHYSLGCEGFKNSCAACPAVKNAFHPMVSARVRAKGDALTKVPHLSIVAPSQWLAGEAGKSSVFSSHSISVIQNPVDAVFFQEVELRQRSDLADVFKVVVVAQNLSDPVKQVEVAVQAFTAALPRLGEAQLTLVGSGGREFQGPGIRHLGSLSKSALAETFAASDVLVVPSRAENAPLVIAEAAANGCSSLVSPVGGMKEMVSALGHGGIFDTTEELTRKLANLGGLRESSPTRLRRMLRERARSLYSPSAVAQQYDKVYSE